MALSPSTNLFIKQLGLLREVDASDPASVTTYQLVPANGYHNGVKFPEDVVSELNAGGFQKTEVEGVEYFKVLENENGKFSHYAQDKEDSHYAQLGVAELTNPSSNEDKKNSEPAPAKKSKVKKEEKPEEPVAEAQNDEPAGDSGE